jgi:hypothetical protein
MGFPEGIPWVLSHAHMQKASLPKWPVLGGHPTNHTPKRPPGVQACRNTKTSGGHPYYSIYDRPPSNHHSYIMQPRIVYIPNRFVVRVVPSLYIENSRVVLVCSIGLLFCFDGGRYAFSALPPGGRPDHR